MGARRVRILEFQFFYRRLGRDLVPEPPRHSLGYWAGREVQLGHWYGRSCASGMPAKNRESAWESGDVHHALGKPTNVIYAAAYSLASSSAKLSQNGFVGDNPVINSRPVKAYFKRQPAVATGVPGTQRQLDGTIAGKGSNDDRPRIRLELQSEFPSAVARFFGCQRRLFH